MSDKQSGDSGGLKPCPIPGCGGDGRKVWGGREVKCKSCGFHTEPNRWQALPRQSDTVRERVPGDTVYKWTATAARKLEYLLRDYPDDKETAKLIADWPSVVAHGTPTGDIQSPSVYTSASVNTINGDAETCPLCGEPEKPDIDCDTCRESEQWDALHTALEECHDALDAANERIGELEELVDSNAMWMQSERDNRLLDLERQRRDMQSKIDHWQGEARAQKEHGDSARADTADLATLLNDPTKAVEDDTPESSGALEMARDEVNKYCPNAAIGHIIDHLEETKKRRDR